MVFGIGIFPTTKSPIELNGPWPRLTRLSATGNIGIAVCMCTGNDPVAAGCREEVLGYFSFWYGGYRDEGIGNQRYVVVALFGY